LQPEYDEWRQGACFSKYIGVEKTVNNKKCHQQFFTNSGKVIKMVWSFKGGVKQRYSLIEKDKKE
jgi:hypothetical protein